jgi:hypothetical protein
MEHWNCVDCGVRISISENKCSSCGYQRTEYDLARAADDTGEYLVSRISLPDTNKFDFGPSIMRILIALILGVGIGGGIILLLKFFY